MQEDNEMECLWLYVIENRLRDNEDNNGIFINLPLQRQMLNI